MVINSKNSITVSQSYKMRGKTRTFKFITFIKNVYLFMWGNKAKQFPVDIRIQESGRQIPVSREVDGNFSSNRITTNHICTVLEEQFTGFSKLLYSYLRDSYQLWFGLVLYGHIRPVLWQQVLKCGSKCPFNV